MRVSNYRNKKYIYEQAKMIVQDKEAVEVALGLLNTEAGVELFLKGYNHPDDRFHKIATKTISGILYSSTIKDFEDYDSRIRGFEDSICRSLFHKYVIDDLNNLIQKILNKYGEMK